jgi:hypothetical protein
MQFFTAVLSALALAASTTTASPIAAREGSSYGFTPQILYPVGGESWPSGSSQTARWDTSGIPANASGLTGVLFLGNNAAGYEIISRKLLPNLLCFTVVVTQQYLSFACTCNPLYSHAACRRLLAGEWVRNLHRAERQFFRQLFCYS